MNLKNTHTDKIFASSWNVSAIAISGIRPVAISKAVLFIPGNGSHGNDGNLLTQRLHVIARITQCGGFNARTISFSFCVFRRIMGFFSSHEKWE